MCLCPTLGPGSTALGAAGRGSRAVRAGWGTKGCSLLHTLTHIPASEWGGVAACRRPAHRRRRAASGAPRPWVPCPALGVPGRLICHASHGVPRSQHPGLRQAPCLGRVLYDHAHKFCNTCLQAATPTRPCAAQTRGPKRMCGACVGRAGISRHPAAAVAAWSAAWASVAACQCKVCRTVRTFTCLV